MISVAESLHLHCGFCAFLLPWKQPSAIESCLSGLSYVPHNQVFFVSIKKLHKIWVICPTLFFPHKLSFSVWFCRNWGFSGIHTLWYRWNFCTHVLWQVTLLNNIHTCHVTFWSLLGFPSTCYRERVHLFVSSHILCCVILHFSLFT